MKPARKPSAPVAPPAAVPSRAAALTPVVVTPPAASAFELGDLAGGIAPAALLLLASVALLGSGRFLEAMALARSA